MNSKFGSDGRDIDFKKKRIRIFFYISSMVPMCFFILVFSLVVLSGIEQEYRQSIDQLSESILAEKRIFIKDAVDRTIYMIEVLREEVARDNEQLDLNPTELNEIAKSKIKALLHGLRFSHQDQYIWVNQIINFDGGDNYAIRAIHPSLPETEGMLLSTLTEDNNGNRPYQTELDGINEQGELYYNYFFKKVNSDEIAHKMSYAKLYKPFDWVIATGIYLDSLEDYINQETAKMQRIYNRQTVLTVIIAGITILIFMFLIILIEKNLNKLVLSYEDEIKKYTGDLEKLSRTDPLTKLNNRLMLDSTFARAIELARRYDNMFSIILLDVDYFKHVNDRFGHQLGDTILQEFSAILSKNTRAVDVVGRWGGEEFLIICPESNLEGTMNLANNLRQKITGHEFPTVGLVTSSFGVACFKKGDTKESMVERADKALYLAKSNGRNRVEYS